MRSLRGDLASATDPEPDLAAARDRLLSYWACTANTASARTALSPKPASGPPARGRVPDFAELETARAWLRTERASLEGAYDVLGCRGDDAVALNYYAAAIAAEGQHDHAYKLYREALAIHRELSKTDVEAVSPDGIAAHHTAKESAT